MYKCLVTTNQKKGDTIFAFCRIQMYDVKSLLVDSGYIYDTSITDGRVGVYQFGQQTLWSNMKVHCLERQNKAMYFNGVDDYVTLTNISALSIYKRFVHVYSH
jgi:hypothetical protein